MRHGTNSARSHSSSLETVIQSTFSARRSSSCDHGRNIVQGDAMTPSTLGGCCRSLGGYHYITPHAWFGLHQEHASVESA